jgi:hypothetical protein
VNGASAVKTFSNEFFEAFGADVLYIANRDDYLKPALSTDLGSEYDIRAYRREVPQGVPAHRV